MNIKNLRALIADLPDDMPVLIPGGDHQLFVPAVGVSNVWKSPGRVPNYYEGSDDGSTNATALVVSRG